MKLMRSGLIALLMFLSIVPGWAQSKAPAKAEGSPQVIKARAVIRAQIEAFAADDAKRAFSFAAPKIRTQFGSPDNFIAMVRHAYPAVYRPANFDFLPAEVSKDAIIQPVSIEDQEGRLWTAVYVLSRQADATWRIDGCQLVPQAGTRT